MKGKSLYALGAVLLISCSSCSAGRIHEKSYLRAVAVEGAAERKLSLVFFSEDGAVTASGKDTGEARENAELKTGRAVFTGYTELIIVEGKDCRGLLEYMLKEWRVSPSCRVICGNGELLLECDAEQLIERAEQAEKKGIAPDCGIVSVLGELYSRGCAEVAELRSDGTAVSRVIY